MKFTTKLTAGFISMGLSVAAFAADPAPAQNPIKFELPKVGTSTAQPAAAPAAPVIPAIQYTQAQLMEVYGFMMAMRMNLPELEFTVADADSISKGIKMALTGEKPPFASDAQALSAQLQEFIGQRQQTLLGKIRVANLAEGTAFFAKLKAENKAVQFLPSGLGLEVIKAGNGPTAKLGQVAKFHYTLSTVNGQVMESSAGREPLEGVVQTDAMIPGMIEALQKIPTGSKYKVYVPTTLAYGDQGGPGMPPGASLIFEIEVLEVKDAPKEVAAPAAK